MTAGLHSVRADRIRDHAHSLHQPEDVARLAREAADDIDNGMVVEGCRRLVAVGGLAKACADTLELGAGR